MDQILIFPVLISYEDSSLKFFVNCEVALCDVVCITVRLALFSCGELLDEEVSRRPPSFHGLVKKLL